MPAESVALCDHIVSLLQGDSSPFDIERVYELTIDLGTFEGQLIRVFPYSAAISEPQTRKEDFFDVRFGVVYLERYAEPSSEEKAVPTEWVDERIAIVEDVIFTVLADPRVFHEFMVGSDNVQYWSQTAEITSYYDYTKLTQNKVFWSECEFVFRKLAVLSGS